MRNPAWLLFMVGSSLAAQADWTLVQTATPPPIGSSAPMVYDSARSRIVLFHQGTWEYDGSDWRLVTTSGPSHRPAAAMAYDSARQRTVLFGGDASGGAFWGETWEWDGSSWVQHAPANSPPAGSAYAMAYDVTRGRTVLFGGTIIDPTGSFYQPFNDTWEWDGTDWTLRNPANRPPRFSGNGSFRILYSAMAYHPRRQTMVVYGGLEVYRTGSVTQRIDTTWEWDGANWMQLPIQGPAFCCNGMAYDDYRQRIVAGPIPYEWDGFGNWVIRNPSVVPPTSGNGLAFDSRRRVVVHVVGGQTWEYATTAPASYRIFGTGCAGAQGAPMLAPAAGSYPWIDGVTSLEVTTLPAVQPVVFMAMGFSDQQFGSLSLPASLGFVGLPACTLYIAPDAIAYVPVVGGTALWFLYIPNRPSLNGLSFFNQAAILDPTAPGGVTLSNASEGVAGLR